MNIQDVLRAQGVKRWHIVETVRQQSIAEHQWNVAMITREICKRMHWPTENTLFLIAKACMHDIDEVIEGDMPSPSKDGPKSYSDDRGGAIVKVADLIEAWWFINEFGVGRHAQQVKGDCHTRLMKFANECGFIICGHVKAVMKDLSTGEFEI